MTEALLGTLALMCIWLVCLGFKTKDGMLQLPFLVGAVSSGFILPQVIKYYDDPSLPSGAMDKTIVMTILCLAAVYIGYISARRPLTSLGWPINITRLTISGAITSVIGAYFFFQVSKLGEFADTDTGGQWSGVITIYVFFASFLTYGLIFALISYLAKPSIWAALVVLIDVAFYLDRILLQGRRADTVELFLIVSLAVWFHRRRALPPGAVIVATLVGALFINSIGDYRAIAKSKKPHWEDVAKIDFVGNLKGDTTKATQPLSEVLNAAYSIAAVDKTLTLDYGAGIWNWLVFRYIPAQIVGVEIKNDLAVKDATGQVPLLDDLPQQHYSFVRWPGTTWTGMAEAFASFWYFGALEFLIVGYIIAKLYRAATRGSLVAQVLLMASITSALHTFTHTTGYFFILWPQLLGFAGPFLFWSRTTQCAPRSIRAAGRPALYDQGTSLGGPALKHLRHFGK